MPGGTEEKTSMSIFCFSKKRDIIEFFFMSRFLLSDGHTQEAGNLAFDFF